MLIDALIFLSISLVYQWYFFRLYIFISFFFFSSVNELVQCFFFSLHFCCLFTFLNFWFISHFQDYIFFFMSTLSPFPVTLPCFSLNIIYSLIIHFNISMKEMCCYVISNSKNSTADKYIVMLNIIPKHAHWRRKKNYRK